jgi:hypothetical protein
MALAAIQSPLLYAALKSPLRVFAIRNYDGLSVISVHSVFFSSSSEFAAELKLDAH